MRFCTLKVNVCVSYCTETLFKTGSLFSHALSALRYASFHETATADSVLGYLIAFLVLLATVKLWHLLRLNPKLHMITATLQRAWTDISGFLVVITIMFLAYSISVRIFPRLLSTCCLSHLIFSYFICYTSPCI